MTGPAITDPWLSARWVDPHDHMRSVEPEWCALLAVAIVCATVVVTVLSATRP